VEIVDALKAWEKATNEVRALAHRQFTPEDCPLATDGMHYEYSEALWGGGYDWNCEFCGKHFTE